MRASAAEFILEGLYAHRRISRNEEHEFIAGERAPREERSEESAGAETTRAAVAAAAGAT